MGVINQNKNFTHFYIFYGKHNNFILIIITSLRNVSIMLPIIEWCESNFPICLEQSALFWHQAVGYSVGKIDVFWKTFDKVRGKIVKIMRSWNTSLFLVQK